MLLRTLMQIYVKGSVEAVETYRRAYAEGMLSTKEPKWIEVNNHALDYFGGVPALVICDNCKQAVIVNSSVFTASLSTESS